MASSSIREVTSSATLEEKKKLRKEFNYFDMIFYTLSALIGLDTLGAFSANGEQALTWLLIAAVTFLLPYGLLTAELGAAPLPRKEACTSGASWREGASSPPWALCCTGFPILSG